MNLNESLSTNPWRERIANLLIPTYLGYLIGVAFLATRAKFAAPSLSFVQLLDVGRYTFRWLTISEYIIIPLIWLLSVHSRTSKARMLSLLAVIVFTIIEKAWVQPILDARVQVYLDGGTPQPSAMHVVFVVLEAGKVLCLLIAALAPDRPLVPKSEA